MKRRPMFVIFMILALMLACNAPSAVTQQANPPIPTETAAAPAAPTATQSTAAATETPTATPDASTFTPTPTLTPSAPMVTPLKDPVNCRFSANANYESVGPGLAFGVSAPILGKTADSSWWQIQNPNGTEKCWIAANVTTASGDLSSVPVVVPPMAFVTNVTFTIKPPSVNLGGGCPGPNPTFSLKGTIYVNGPTTVDWHIESEKDGSLPPHSLTFTKYGFQNISTSYTATYLHKGHYWVHLVITSPNSMTEEVMYEIKCS